MGSDTGRGEVWPGFQDNEDRHLQTRPLGHTHHQPHAILNSSWPMICPVSSSKTPERGSGWPLKWSTLVHQEGIDMATGYSPRFPEG